MLAIDANMVLVSETYRMMFVTSFGSYGKNPGQFDCLGGVAVDNSGVVYVCDSKNNRVQVF